MRIVVTVDGQEKATRAFRVVDESLRDWRGVWPEIQGYLLRASAEQFDSIGSRGGQQWRPLSPRYAKWKELNYPGQPILVRTGALRESLTRSGANGNVANFQPLFAEYGTSIRYAKFHQRGTRRMPARPPFAPTARDIDRIVSRLFRYSEEVAKGAGFETRSRARRTPGAE